ncbi:cation transporter [Pseudanabaenaceae cyanobacterium LEGE 13415]|nr:cation transporter [Pseudanabaenaceae cyanobacterium LEGE 13415]
MKETASSKQADRLLRRGLLLEYLTLGWNVVGAMIVMVAALPSQSIALIGFGLDSLVEIGASIVVIWQLRSLNHPGREQFGLRLIGTSFFVIATYVFVQSASTLITQARPEASPLGISWLAATFLVMLGLAAGKAQTGKKLNHAILKTEARVTLIDAYLAGSVLLGLLLNAGFRWWWADSIAGLVIVFYGFKEGWHVWVESSQV